VQVSPEGDPTPYPYPYLGPILFLGTSRGVRPLLLLPLWQHSLPLQVSLEGGLTHNPSYLGLIPFPGTSRGIRPLPRMPL